MTFLQRLKRDKKFRGMVLLIAVLAFILYNTTDPEKKTVATEEQCNEIFQPPEGLIDWTCFLQHCTVGFPFTLATCWIPCITVDSVYKHEAEECLNTNGCYIQATQSATYDHADLIQCWKQAWGTHGYVQKCTSSVPNGGYVYETQVGCESNYGNKVGSVCFKDIYQCKDNPDPVTTCNDAEARIASIFLWDKYVKDCKMAYYLTLFGGAMIAFMMIGMVM